MSRKEILEHLTKTYEAVKDRIDNGIEQNRKGDFKVTLKNTDGSAVSDVKLTLKQKKHAFRFGANIFMLDELETPEKNEIYKERFKSLFNMATLTFYWSATEPERGLLRYEKNSPPLYRRPATDLCMEFCRENGIEPREHGLAYGSQVHAFPTWVKSTTSEEEKQLLEKRFGEISERYADEIRTIEVTNEMGKFVAQSNFYFEEDYLPFCYKLAEKYFPNNQIGINEDSGTVWHSTDGKWARYYMTIEKLLQMGCRVDAIGMQYHMFYRLEEEMKRTKHFYNLRHLLWILDTYATLDKPIQITEITIPAYSWETEDEQIQAEILEKLYRLWFSHPAVEQIIYWNLVDGYAHAAEPGDMTAGENYYHGALLRFDGSEKPAYKCLKDLIHKEWHTEESGECGERDFAFRGFYGEYEASITVDGRTHTLPFSLKKGEENHIVFTL
jgi:GH35 family endo-1,4-beta-xylanase